MLNGLVVGNGTALHRNKTTEFYMRDVMSDITEDVQRF